MMKSKLENPRSLLWYEFSRNDYDIMKKNCYKIKEIVTGVSFKQPNLFKSIDVETIINNISR
jgi:hypothetical protein